MRTVIAITALLTLGACSTKSLYLSGVQSQKSQCIKEANSESQLRQCEQEAKARPSYEEYEKQRKAITKGGG